MSLERALAWASNGWPVFPCALDGKPLVDAWQKKATTEPEAIGVWWADYPDAVPGVVPGLIGCWVLDVDVKNGHAGMASLATLEEQYDFEAWDTPQQRTRSGGLHLFFRGTAKTGVGVLGDGLDTRGGSPDGGLGYVVAYAEEPPCEPRTARPSPAGLIERLGQIRQRDEETQASKVELDLPANLKRAEAYIRGLPTPEIGQRNITVFKVVARLKDLGVSLATAFELIEAYPSVAGGLIEENLEEFNNTVRSAYRNGQLQPGVQAINEDAKNAIAAKYDAGPLGTPAGRGEGFDEDGEGEEESPSGVRRRAVRLDAWSARRRKEPPAWLVRGLLARGNLAGLYGAGGSYKSFVALDLGAALATATDRWGECVVEASGGVVYVSGEGSAEPRLRGWEAARAREIPDNLALVDGIDLADADCVTDLFKAIDEAVKNLWAGNNPILLMVDTLARAAPGQDENSAKDMGMVVAAADAIIARYGCAVLFVHHTPKSGDDWRGSTAVWNSLDVALHLKRTGRNKAIMKLVRSKDGEIGSSWDVALKPVETGMDRAGVPEKTLVIEQLAPKVQTDAQGTAEEKQENIKHQAAMAEIALDTHRAQVAGEVLKSVPPGWTASAKQITQFMMVKLGPGASTEACRKWVGRVVQKDGQLNAGHPLAPYVLERSPLTFAPPAPRPEASAPPGEPAS